MQLQAARSALWCEPLPRSVQRCVYPARFRRDAEQVRTDTQLVRLARLEVVIDLNARGSAAGFCNVIQRQNVARLEPRGVWEVLSAHALMLRASPAVVRRTCSPLAAQTGAEYSHRAGPRRRGMLSG